MAKADSLEINPVHEIGVAFDHALGSVHRRVAGAVRTGDTHLIERLLTPGELSMVRRMFGAIAGIEQARIFPFNFWWPYPNNRAMTPAGSIYFPSQDYRDDYSASDVSVTLRALFMHEATHLYQTYASGWTLKASGPWDRNYQYELVKGKALRAYGIEQMGQIVQDFYTIRQGGFVRGLRYRVADYADAVPVHHS